MELSGASFPFIKRDDFQRFYHSGPSRLERFLRFPDGHSHDLAEARILESVVEKTSRQIFEDLANLAHSVYQQCFLFRPGVMDLVVQHHYSAPSAYEAGILFLFGEN